VEPKKNYNSMDEAALDAFTDFQELPEESQDIIRNFLKKWYLVAGYKKICKLIIKE